MRVLDHSLKSNCGDNGCARELRSGGGSDLRPFAESHQIAVDQEHREIHQNPRGQHEDDGIEAQDVEKPQVVDSGVSQYLGREDIMGLTTDRNGKGLVAVQSREQSC